MARVLVVGGAGYVGSAAAAWLIDQGHEVSVLDDLSTGHRELVLGDHFVQARAGDRAQVAELLKSRRIECVMHFAAKALVAESVAFPERYFENNVDQTRALIETMLECGVQNFIFSSTCAIFGDPSDRAISEDLPKGPVNPYGESKLKAEEVLEHYASTRGLRAIALRYFNAAGAEIKGRVGEWHQGETHLIPRLLAAALENRPIEIYGNDYPTADGTAVRDYVHVTDLAAAHEAAMKRLLEKPGHSGSFEAYNLGSEEGYSVRDVVRICEQVVGKRFEIREMPRRPGDPPRLIADSTRARGVLGFEAGRVSRPIEAGDEDGILRGIIQTAYHWECKRRGKLKRAVFLDRDGTINEDPGYLRDPDELKLLPGVGEALAKLNAAGFMLVVVSNQSGVGRGLFDVSILSTVHQRLDELLKGQGAKIHRYELCLHRPDDLCECRKPRPKLLLDAAIGLGVDVSRSFMVGDKLSDIQAGVNAGCEGRVLVRTGYGREAERELKQGEASFISDSLPGAVDWILKNAGL